MLQTDYHVSPSSLRDQIEQLWEHSAVKITSLHHRADLKSTPVFTVNGKYTSRGWTEWTQGFQFGSEVLQFDATQDRYFLDKAREHTLEYMPPHISHTGVHDHGFNNLSTFGNLLRLMLEGKIPENPWERNYYELAVKISGAVQASRWIKIPDGGYIYSFNGPHSLFVDTIRSLRIVMMSHLLGHVLYEENDKAINLMERALQHAYTTALYSIYYGEGRDIYDVAGRVSHEAIFNIYDGHYRCPNSQQGYSPFSTWTRGLAWAILGYAEQLEILQAIPEDRFPESFPKEKTMSFMHKAALATSDFYLNNMPTDGIPYWDTGAPGLSKLGNYLDHPADPFNPFEPVDSSAAAIASQGLLRFGKFLEEGEHKDAKIYRQAGLTIASHLMKAPYLSTEASHEGLLLHSIYHAPMGWDYVPEGSTIPYGESSQWGDYHLRELALYIQRLNETPSNYLHICHPSIIQ